MSAAQPTTRRWRFASASSSTFRLASIVSVCFELVSQEFHFLAFLEFFLFIYVKHYLRL